MRSYILACLIIVIIIFNWVAPKLIVFVGGDVLNYMNVLLLTNIMALLYIILPTKITLE